MEPIAVVGLGCRLPQANNPDEFWQLLRDGREAVVQVPESRWDIEAFYDPSPDAPGKMSTRWGAFLERVDGFDAEFFGLTAEELEHIDPQQRLFLEVAWEALEQGGIVPKQLAGTQTGVFIGLCTVDYHRLLYKSFERIGPHSGTGTTMCITANRLSYLLDLRGPSIAIDAACSSSLVTVHLACQSLRSHESDMCIAGGVNLILSPDSTISSSRTRLLSPTGSCRPFDEDADGYVRGEGCGVVILKRLSDAQRDGDNILALIRGSAVNQDGLSNSLTAPNGLAQKAVIQRALDNGGVAPHEIDYVEAHAVGTPLGDAIEFRALSSVLGDKREAAHPCWVGSAKPNIGHLEAASGIAALIKVILLLQHEQIPAHPHFNQANSYMSLNGAMAIPTQPQPWRRGERQRLAGVSAFGFGGTNTHVVLEEAPVQPCNDSKESASGYLFNLSAKTPAALFELANRYQTLLSAQVTSLADLCFTVNTGRTHFEHRLSILTESIDQLRQQLRSCDHPHLAPGVAIAHVKRRRQPKIAFVFPAVDNELWEIGRQLYFSQPVFQQAFYQCELAYSALESQSSQSSDSPQSLSARLGMPDSADEPAMAFAIMYALASLYQAWGISPKAAAGAGVGQTVAACLAGILSLEEAMGHTVNGSMATFTVPKKSRRGISLINLSSDGLQLYDIVLIAGGEIDHPALVNKKQLCLSTDQSVDNSLLQVISALHLEGVNLNWHMGNSQRRRLPMPTYPFQRQRYWFKPEHREPTPIWASSSPASELPSLLHQLKEKHAFSDAQLEVLPQVVNTLANHPPDVFNRLVAQAIAPTE